MMASAVDDEFEAQDPFEKRILYSEATLKVKDILELTKKAVFFGSNSLEKVAYSASDIDIWDVTNVTAEEIKTKVNEIKKQHTLHFLELKAGIALNDKHEYDVPPLGILEIKEGKAFLTGFDRDATMLYAEKHKIKVDIPATAVLTLSDWFAINDALREAYILRWSVEDIATGELDNVELKQAIKQPSLVKIDVIYNMAGTYVEAEVLYKRTSDNVKKTLTQGIIKMLVAKNYAKAFKRMFALAMAEKDEEWGNELLKYYKTPYMMLYRIKARLETLIQLIRDKVRAISTLAGVDQLIDRLVDMSAFVPIKTEFIEKLQIYEMPRHKAITELEDVVSYLSDLVNDHYKTVLQALKFDYRSYSAVFDDPVMLKANNETIALNGGKMLDLFDLPTADSVKKDDPMEPNNIDKSKALVQFHVKNDNKSEFVFPPPFRLLALGSSGAGKSFAVVALLLSPAPYFYRGYFKQINIICPTLDTSQASPYSAIDFTDDNINVYTDIDDSVISHIFANLPKDNDNGYAPSLLLLDDLGKIDQNGILSKKLWQQARHHSVSCIYIAQYLTMVPKTIRMSISDIMLFKQPRAMVDMVAQDYLSRKLTDTIMTVLDEKPRNFVYINNRISKAYDNFDFGREIKLDMLEQRTRLLEQHASPAPAKPSKPIIISDSEKRDGYRITQTAVAVGRGKNTKYFHFGRKQDPKKQEVAVAKALEYIKTLAEQMAPDVDDTPEP